MTGQDFWVYLQQKLDKAYSAYLDSTKANSLIRETMYRTIDKMYHDLSFEKEADELIGLIIKDFSATPSSGICSLNATVTTPTPPANEIPYYLHTMRILAYYEFNISVTAVGTTLTCIDNTLRIGSTIKYSGTTYTVTWLNGDNFKAKDANGVYATASGTYVWFFDRETRQMSSTRKAGSFHKANIVTPRYEFLNSGTGVNRSVRVTPFPTTIKIDYVRVPPVQISVTDTTIDLLGYYSEKFLYHLMDECVLNFASQTKDFQSKQSALQDIIQNP